MKFVVSTGLLHKKLSAIAGVISNNPIVPILENFLLKIENGQLTAVASDLQTTMMTSLPVEADEEGSVAVPAKILLDTLKSLPEQPITISVDLESFVTEIQSANGLYKLTGENALDFPSIPNTQSGIEISIPARVLSEAISNTIFAASNDELRPAMNGIFVELRNNHINFVATDGNRLIRYRRNDLQASQESAFIIPKKAFNLLKGALPHDDSAVSMIFTNHNAFFDFNHTRTVCRLIEERFPEYENVIPQNNDKILTIERQELLNSLKRLDIYANRATHLVRFRLHESQLEILAEDIDFSNEAVERISCEYIGEPMEIGFNARYLIEMLGAMDSQQVKITLSQANRAGVLLPAEQAEGEDTLMLLMPIMLSNYV